MVGRGSAPGTTPSPAALHAESLGKQEPRHRGFVCPLQAVPDSVKHLTLLPAEAALLELKRLVFLNAATRIPHLSPIASLATQSICCTPVQK